MPKVLQRGGRVPGSSSGAGAPVAATPAPTVALPAAAPVITPIHAPSTAAGPITGSGGAVPPPGAPREVSQPLSQELIAAQAARARQNEQQLKPLIYNNPRPPVPGVAAGAGSSTEVAAASHEVHGVPDVVAAGMPAQVLPPQSQQIPPEDLSRFPAASNTDSPSRGQPVPSADPNKQITGGFAIGQPQYFPLDGQELRVMVEQLLDQVFQRIQNDLRFSIAVVYPRVSARVLVEVVGFEAHDAANFQIPQVMRPHEKTPIEVARDHANEICFIVLEQAREVNDQGESLAAPDQIRAELGLQIPRKQQVDTGTGFQLADVVLRPGDAGTR